VIIKVILQNARCNNKDSNEIFMLLFHTSVRSVWYEGEIPKFGEHFLATGINLYTYIYIVYIQDVPGGMCQTSGECSLGQTIPI